MAERDRHGEDLEADWNFSDFSIIFNPMRRWVVTALRVFLILLSLFIAYRLTLSMMVRAKLEEIRKKGYPATSQELDQWYVKPPREKDATGTYIKAFSLFSDKYTPRWDQKSSPQTNGIPFLSPTSFPPLRSKLPVEMKKKLASCVAANAESIKLFHQVPPDAQCRFPHDLTKGWLTLTPNLAYIRHGTRLLVYEAVLDAENGQYEKVAQSLSASLTLSRALDTEPLLISQLVRIASYFVSVTGLEQVLSKVDFSDDELVRLSAALGDGLSENADSKNLERGFVGERCMASDFLGMSPSEQYAMIQAALPESTEKDRFLVLPILYLFRMTGLTDWSHLRYLKEMERCLNASQFSLPERYRASKAIADDLDRGTDFGGSGTTRKSFGILYLASPAILGFVERDNRWIGLNRAAQTAVAIERYRLVHKKVPDKLEALVPKYLRTVPTDPFDGQPLRYKKTQKGYVVYSVGEDEKDNGGDDSKMHFVDPDIAFHVER